MAQIVANATKLGNQRPSGQQPFTVVRGSTVANHVTLAFDNTQITLKGQVLTAVQQMLATFGDQLK